MAFLEVTSYYYGKLCEARIGAGYRENIGRNDWILGMKVREIIKRLETDGWYRVTVEGSHRQFKHPVKEGKVTVAGKMGDDVRKGTLASILRQAKLK